MSDFKVLIQSLAEHVGDYIGLDHVQAASIFADEIDGTAHIEIQLRDNSWPEQSRAIDKMLELRTMFLDELAIDYIFVDEKSELSPRAPEPAATFVA